eukprot:jgi/Mesvir1/29657/Mv21499-RA.1
MPPDPFLELDEELRARKLEALEKELQVLEVSLSELSHLKLRRGVYVKRGEVFFQSRAADALARCKESTECAESKRSQLAAEHALPTKGGQHEGSHARDA